MQKDAVIAFKRTEFAIYLFCMSNKSETKSRTLSRFEGSDTEKKYIKNSITDDAYKVYEGKS